MSLQADSHLVLDGGISSQAVVDDGRPQFGDLDYSHRLFACGLCHKSFDHKDRLLQHLANDHWEPRDQADDRYLVKSKSAAQVTVGRKLRCDQSDIANRRTALPSKRSSKKTSPAGDKDEKTQRQLDVLLGKRKQEYEALEERLKYEPFYDDDSVLLFRFNEQKAVYGSFSTSLTSAGGKYMLRKSSANSRPPAMPKMKTPGKSSATGKQRGAKQTGGRRGRPKKRNKEEVVEAEPANWKWRSNVCVPLTDLDNVKCGYKNCEKIVSSVKNYHPAKRVVASHDEALVDRVQSVHGVRQNIL